MEESQSQTPTRAQAVFAAVRALPMAEQRIYYRELRNLYTNGELTPACPPNMVLLLSTAWKEFHEFLYPHRTAAEIVRGKNKAMAMLKSLVSAQREELTTVLMLMAQDKLLPLDTDHAVAACARQLVDFYGVKAATLMAKTEPVGCAAEAVAASMAEHRPQTVGGGARQ